MRWGLLYGFAVIALLSHLLLDWTNNYGLRPFFPFNPRWYAGSFVFIFEPLIFVLLLIGLIAPSLFGLINSEVGARREMYRGRGWAIFALLGIVAVWGWRFYERENALKMACREWGLWRGAGGADGSELLSGDAVSLVCGCGDVRSFTGRFRSIRGTGRPTSSDAHADLFYKPPTTIATLVAKRSWLGEAYLDWSMYPLVKETGVDADGNATVTFNDFRFMYDTPIFSGRSKPALAGTVLINTDHRVERMEFDGREEVQR